MGFSLGHVLLVLLVVLVLFGTNRLPEVMGNIAKGYKAFLDGLKDEKLALRDDDQPKS